MFKNSLSLLSVIVMVYLLSVVGGGCAQVGFPTGGVKDTLAPVLSKATPENNKLNFTGNKITLTFDEYIELKDPQTNMLVSPVQKKNVTIGSNLKTVSIKFKDTLQPNTTYSIDFGNAIVDIHEGNILKNFTYTFSTGNYIDSFQLRGKVVVAETGKTDSTILVYLYKNANDTDVLSKKPDYIERLNGDGIFNFKHLPAANFKIYALKDGDGGKTYNSKTEIFAFNDTDINSSNNSKPVILYAFAEEKEKAGSNAQPSNNATKKTVDKKLRYSVSSGSGKGQDLLSPLEISFTSPLKNYDSTKFVLSDTNYKPIPGIRAVLDTSRTKVTLQQSWLPEMQYILTIGKDAVSDSADLALEKSDTIRFITKKESAYGSITFRFSNLDLSLHPVIQFVQSDVVKFSFPVTASEWSRKLFEPGEYEVRILYDSNQNGKWDPGNYKERIQPERAIGLPQKIAIKADWENEREISL